MSIPQINISKISTQNFKKFYAYFLAIESFAYSKNLKYLILKKSPKITFKNNSKAVIAAYLTA